MRKIILLYFLITMTNFSFAALDASACASLVKSEIVKLNAAAGGNAYVVEYWTAICKGIIDHIKAAAVVVNNGTCAIPSGSSTGTWPTTSTGLIQ